MVGMFSSFSDLLSIWTTQELAADLGVKYQTAVSMKQRGSVAPAHWPLLVAASERKGRKIDMAILAQLAASRKARSNSMAA